MWDHSTFSHNRDRLFNQDVARLFFQRIKSLDEWSEYASDEHFSVDDTLIDARPRTIPSSRRTAANHQSTSDPAARLARKSNGDASRLHIWRTR